MWLSDAEYDRYDRQVELETAAHERLRGYLAAHTETFAGIWYGAELDREPCGIVAGVSRRLDSLKSA